MPEYWKIVLLTNCFTYACHSACLFILSDKKDGRLLSAFRMAGFWMFMVSLCAFAVTHRLKNFYWFITNFDMVLAFIVFCRDSRGCIAKNLFIVSAYATYFYVTMIPCELSLQFLPPPWRFALYTPIRVAMYALLMLFWLKKGRGIFLSATGNITDARWKPLCAFSVTSIFCITFVMTRLLMLNQKNSVWDYAISVCVLLAVLSAYVLVIRIMDILNRESAFLSLRTQAALLRSELAAERAFVSQAKKHRHDMRHHNQLLLSLAEDGNVEGIKAYLSEYEGVLDSSALPAFCANTVANAVLGNFSRAAESEGMACSIHAPIPASLPLSDTETCSLFGNLLENALEAMKKCAPPARFDLNAQVKDDILSILSRNTVAEKVRFKGGFPVSTKNGGLGTKIIHEILAKHDGMVEYAQDGGDFCVKIRLPLDLSDGYKRQFVGGALSQ